MATHQPRLEVFPEHRRIPTNGHPDGDDQTEQKHYVRLVAGNGAKLMVSEAYDNPSNAVRAAHAINRATSGSVEYPNGRLSIEILDQDEAVRRVIEPKYIHLEAPPPEDGVQPQDGGWPEGTVLAGFDPDGPEPMDDHSEHY